MALFASLNSNTFRWPVLRPHNMTFQTMAWAALATIRTAIKALTSSYAHISTQFFRFRVVPAILGWSGRTERADSKSYGMCGGETYVRGPELSNDPLESHMNLVTWALSGEYDEDQPILIDADSPDRFVSRKRAVELVASLAGQFPRNSTVCLHVANDILYPILVLAILASECRWTGTNTAYTVAELVHHLNISRSDIVITARQHLDVVRKAVQVHGSDVEIIIYADLLQDTTGELDESSTNNGDWGFDSLRTMRDLVQHPVSDDIATVTKGISPDSIAALMQTSGTTGQPKLATRTHRSMMIEQQAIEDNDLEKPYKVRRLYCIPIFHAFAAPEMMFNVLRLGQQSYFMKRFDDTFAQKVHEFGVTEIAGAPPLLLKLANTPDCQHLLQSVRLISYGGAALGPELRKQTMGIFEVPPRIVPVYGMTEGGWFTMLKHPEDDDSGSVGRPIAGYEIKVVPQIGAELQSGQVVGEVLVRGPQLMTEYLNNPSATAEAFENGWLKTGDIGYIRDGKVYLVDRAKDLIKVSGFQVAPAELEDALLESPDILDAAVVGVGQDVDEHPLACVVPRGASVTVERVKSHLRKRLTGYKVNRCEVRFVESIPKSSSGKMLRKVLKEQISLQGVALMR